MNSFDLQPFARLTIFPTFPKTTPHSVEWWNQRSRWPLARRHAHLVRKRICHYDDGDVHTGELHCFCPRNDRHQPGMDYGFLTRVVIRVAACDQGRHAAERTAKLPSLVRHPRWQLRLGNPRRDGDGDVVTGPSQWDLDSDESDMPSVATVCSRVAIAMRRVLTHHALDDLDREAIGQAEKLLTEEADFVRYVLSDGHQGTATSAWPSSRVAIQVPGAEDPDTRIDAFNELVHRLQNFVEHPSDEEAGELYDVFAKLAASARAQEGQPGDIVSGPDAT